ncbi:GPI mannosyltransferase 2 [Fusarium oxysporum f. sp. albedinis]|nr:GPI mannosyltransferase 2 [Fusarium oxysporum f. sp. albedinis]
MSASSRFRSGVTIRPAAANILSHSADIGWIVRKSSAIRERRGYRRLRSCQYDIGSLTSLSPSSHDDCHNSSSLVSSLMSSDKVASSFTKPYPRTGRVRSHSIPTLLGPSASPSSPISCYPSTHSRNTPTGKPVLVEFFPTQINIDSEVLRVGYLRSKLLIVLEHFQQELESLDNLPYIPVRANPPSFPLALLAIAFQSLHGILVESKKLS